MIKLIQKKHFIKQIFGSTGFENAFELFLLNKAANKLKEMSNDSNTI